MNIKIIKINKKEFELEDGRIYQHLIQLEKPISIKQFQSIYDYWQQIIKEEN